MDASLLCYVVYFETLGGVETLQDRVKYPLKASQSKHEATVFRVGLAEPRHPELSKETQGIGIQPTTLCRASLKVCDESVKAKENSTCPRDEQE